EDRPDNDRPGDDKAGDSKPDAANGPEQSAAAKAGKSSKRRQAAEQLAQAQREFAQGQRGAGEAAEEIAGQSQIANRPLRDAMERASKLPFPNLPASRGPVRAAGKFASPEPNDPAVH